MSLIGQKITVLGGGVAGLAVATALARRGAAVSVLEQSEVIRDIGAGLQISPNGARVLQALGLGEALSRGGIRSGAVELRDGLTGGRLLHMDIAPAQDGADYVFVHRADLISMLLEAARASGVKIQLLQKIERVELGDHPPRIVTAQGAQREVGVLIGADGLHSKVREALNGRVAPFFTHQVAWRALVPCEPGAAAMAQVFVGPGRHLVSYPLRGGSLRNIVAVEERHRWAEESWSAVDDPLAVQVAFEDFAEPVRGWLQKIERVNVWGLFRHPVAERWWANGAAILGDAAHPTLPFLAQGANMALEDAWVLAASLAGHDSLDAAFAAYQAAREARTRRIVNAATANARNFHLRGPMRALGHLGLKLGGALAPGLAMRRFRWLYDFDVTRG